MMMMFDMNIENLSVYNDDITFHTAETLCMVEKWIPAAVYTVESSFRTSPFDIR